MTTTQKTYLKHNWITFANLVLLLTLVYNYATSQQEVRDDINNLKKHANDGVIHMPLSEKIKIFVPRIELDSRLESIEDRQRAFGIKQEAMYKLLLESKGR